ncbi:MAG TPA: OmpA family protein [Sphingobium sp.]|uniref:OmpA family protein n=1 Tax=Sphingobium sp. TaxID=1912891 RepID=UPI002ED579C8
MIQKFTTGAMLVAMLASTAACTTDPDTGQRRVSNAGLGAGIGAVGGYLLGDLVGGRNSRTERLLGAGIGAVAGAGIGSYMDGQERKLRERTAGTGIDVVRQGDDLLLRMPSSITFATNQAIIEPHFRSTLDNVSQVLTEYPKTYVDVMGHTDSDGSDTYNQALSERRATSVADYLSSHGVNAARLATRGFGKTQPIASNDTPEGKAQNRRVEIKLVPVTEGDVASARRY